MSEYIVSARKYRPAAFEMVVGQRSLTDTLRNAIRTGHLAHAYLFCGPRGVGKTTCARIFAKTINCLTPTADHDACNECESCRAFNEQRSFNIHELDAASNNSVEDIRSLIEQVRIPPQVGKYSVYIIDEVHMLSQSAFNALLKTLEEPPSYAIFILATTEKHKVLPTILSRCQVFDFQRITLTDIVEHLRYVATQEGVTAVDEALHVVAMKADGGMRDALSIFDQLVTYCGSSITYEQAIAVLNVLDSDYYFRAVDYALAGNVSGVLLLFNEVLCKGFDGGHFLSGLASHLRDVLVSKDVATTVLLETSDSVRQRFAAQANKCTPRWIFAALDAINQTEMGYRTARNKRLVVELLLVKLTQLNQVQVTPQQSAPTPVQSRPATSAVPQTAASQNRVPQAVTTQPHVQQPVATQPHVQQPVTPSVQRATVVTASSQQVPTPQPAVTPVPIPNAPIPGTPMPGSPIPNAPIVGAIPGIPVAGQPQPAVPTTNAPLQQRSVEGTGNVPFSQEQMANAWNAMRSQLFASDRRMSALLSNIAPVKKNELAYEVPVLNIIQQSELQEQKSKIMAFLVAQLKNNCFTLDYVVSEEDMQTTEAFTAEERVKLLQEANPFLQQFRTSLGLLME
ncbi:MAG: DNA polymerase III subunit gamma/tau [Paludibacteraceae bacterium]|nr:DNA polymerase III subunit gamma/tau [Paludibacteraceae bacterium]